LGAEPVEERTLFLDRHRNAEVAQPVAEAGDAVEFRPDALAAEDVDELDALAGGVRFSASRSVGASRRL
jgi:hypothetical protein